MSPHTWLRTGLLLLLTAVPAADARGNAAPPVSGSGGIYAGHPLGLTGVRVVRAAVTVDLRAVTHTGRARVEATYQLDVAEPRTLTLTLPAGGDDVAGVRVSLDGRPVDVRPAEAAPVPESWAVPARTPRIGGDHDVEYNPGRGYRRWRDKLTPIAVAVAVPAGAHELTLAYDAAAGANTTGSPTKYRQFAFVRAPEREWAGFGGVDVTVHLPPGWAAAAAPELARDGDTLRGRLTDSGPTPLTVTVQAPAGAWYTTVQYAGVVALVFAGIGGLGLCVAVGRWRAGASARAERCGGGWWARSWWPWSVAAGLGWGAAVLAAGVLAAFGPDLTIPRESSSGIGPLLYFLVVLLAAALAVPIGSVATQLTARVARGPSPAD